MASSTLTRAFLLAVAGLLPTVTSSPAQSLRQFRYLTTDDGLPSAHVTAAYQDPTGYMWFATKAGVVRWDGYEFKSISRVRYYEGHPPAGLPIWIGAGAEGEILVAGYGGLASIGKDDSMQPLLADASSPTWGGARWFGGNGVYVAPSEPGVYWVSTYGGGLIRWVRPSDSVHVFLPDAGDPYSLPSTHVTMPLEDRDRNLWVPTQAGLCYLDRSDLTFHLVTHNPVVTVLEDPKRPGILWLEEGKTLSRFDVATHIREPVLNYSHQADVERPPHFFRFETLPSSMIWDRLARGVLWVAVRGAGVYRYDSGTGDVEMFPSNVPGKPHTTGPNGGPSCVFQDRTGVLWVCSYSSGVSYAEPAGVRSTTINTELRGTSRDSTKVGGYVTALIEDHLGRLWMGNRDGVSRHLLMIDPASGEERRWFGVPAGADGGLRRFGEIFALLEDRRGDIWIGEVHVDYISTAAQEIGNLVWDRGVLHRLSLDDERFVSFEHEADNPKSLPEGGIVSLHEDSDGIIWAGTRDHGIARIEPNSGSITTINISHSSNSAWGFLEDDEGRLWVGSTDVICLLDRQRHTCSLFRLPGNVGHGMVHLAEGKPPPGTLWVGTWEGLFRFDPETETFMKPPSAPALKTAHIVDLVADEESALWLSTDADGVFRFDPSSGVTTSEHIEYPYYGLGAGVVTSKGEVVFGSLGSGLRVFKPHGSFGNAVPPQVVVTGISEQRNGTSEILLATGVDEIRLEHPDESFSIEYVALHYSDPARNQYAYLMEGLQDQWQYVGGSRRATFSALPPGEYTFRVKGANSYGVWDNTGASLRIFVPPHWWQTWWAYLIYAAMILGGLVTAERFRHASIVRTERHRAALRETEIRSEVAEERASQAAEHAQRLEELSEAKSRFFANISHEFRTPLTLILGVAEDVENGRVGRPTEALRKAVHLIVRNARRVDELVRELLDLSRIESGSMKLAVRQNDLGQTIHGLVRSHIPLAERNQLDLKYHGPQNHVWASFDADRIRTAVANLISNAVKFTEKGGLVEVSLQTCEEREGGSVARIIVRDDGAGIREEDLPHVFERFYQVDTASTRTKAGIGIGLAMVKELVELHGGTVGVRSELGVGSTFTIDLPLFNVPEVDGGPSEDAGESPATRIGVGKGVSAPAEEYELGGDGASAVDLGGENETVESSEAITAPLVLIVEDNYDVLAFLRHHFEQYFRVLEAPNGREGLRMTRDHTPDLVVSDIMMPDMDGIEMCRAIKGDPKLRNVPVILVTARAGEEEVLEGLKAGADEYITKPFSVAILVQLAKNVLASRARLLTDSDRTTQVEMPDDALESQDAALLRRVVEVIEDHIGDAFFTVDMLADEIGLSRRQLERRIPDACGDSPSQLVRRIRLERARQLLENDVGTVSEITHSTGYRSPSRFATAFRRVYGMTPSEYRRANNKARRSYSSAIPPQASFP